MPWPGFLTNREQDSGRREEKKFFFFHISLYVFLSAGELCHVLMGRSAASKLRRKSQREASELRDQSDDTLAMEEEELAREEEDEIVFKRRKTVPDTPRASRANTPDPDDGEEDHQQFATVLQLVKSVRDQIKALVLDNTNIRAACDDLRRQCHSQGVAFVTFGEQDTGGPGRVRSIFAWPVRTSSSYQAGAAGR